MKLGLAGFGAAIRTLRERHGLTQRELADRVGVNFTYISKIERATIPSPPSEAIIRRLAEVLDTDAESLLDQAGRVDFVALQRVAREIPEAGALIRRIQARRVSPEQMRQLLAKLGDGQEEER